MNKKVVIVGAGLGGLATALRLSVNGYDVEIVEKHSTAGGRLNQIKKEGFTFDTGPSFFSMSYEFEKFASDCGIKLPFEYFELDPLYSVHFRNREKPFHLYKNIDKLAEQFKEIEPNFKENFEKYIGKAEALFKDTVDLVIKRNFDSVLDYFLTLARVNPSHLPVLFRSFWQQVKLYFDSEEASQILSLVAFFLGKTPFDTMAVYTLLSYTEFRYDGYYNVSGGMYKITEGLVEELTKRGVKIHYNTEIKGYSSSPKRLDSVIDSTGKEWKADIFIINADAPFFSGSVLGDAKYSADSLKKMDWTMGYLTFYVGIDCKLPEVNHHNYYLGANYSEYAEKIKRELTSSETPYYYVNVLSKHNRECAPEGCESLFFVCPVPNLLYKDNWDDREEYFSKIVNDFSARTGVDINSHIVTKSILTPEEWRDTFNLYMGSGLGLSHKFSQIGGLRPTNRHSKYNNTFFVGASTVPGAGLPMAIISSKLAAERVMSKK